MAKKTEMRPSELTGISIYQDPKRGTIFYDLISRRAYILTRSDVKKYNIYSSLLIVCIVIAIAVANTFKLGYINGVIIAVALLIICMAYFRFTFFYQLPLVENWKPFKRKNIFENIAERYETGRIIALVVMLALLSVLMPFYGRNAQLQGLDMYANYIISAVTALAALLFLVSLIIKLRKK